MFSRTCTGNVLTNLYSFCKMCRTSAILDFWPKTQSIGIHIYVFMGFYNALWAIWNRSAIFIKKRKEKLKCPLYTLNADLHERIQEMWSQKRHFPSAMPARELWWYTTTGLRVNARTCVRTPLLCIPNKTNKVNQLGPGQSRKCRELEMSTCDNLPRHGRQPGVEFFPFETFSRQSIYNGKPPDTKRRGFQPLARGRNKPTKRTFNFLLL